MNNLPYTFRHNKKGVTRRHAVVMGASYILKMCDTEIMLGVQCTPRVKMGISPCKFAASHIFKMYDAK